MPKRKSDDNYDHIERKIRKLEKKLRNRSKRDRHRKSRRRGRRRRGYSSTDDESSSATTNESRRSPSLDQQDENDGYVDLEENEEDATAEAPQPSNSRADSPVNRVPSIVVVPSDLSEPSQTATEQTATAEAVTPSPAQPDATPASPAPIETLSLDTELLDILGTDPTTDKKYGKDVHKDLPVRFEHWATTGLSKEIRKELKEKYRTPENCKLIDPPELNPEIKAALSDINIKRDKAIEGKQKQITSAITCLGEAISHVLSAREKDTTLLKLLMDSVRIVCDSQHADTLTRRNFILNSVKKEMREQLQNTKIDKLLFGENLSDTLKSAKAISKSGIDLKPAAPKIPNKKPVPSTSTAPYGKNNLNWKNPGQARRPMAPPRMKEPATTLTRNRPSASSRPSPHQQRTSYKRN